LDAGMCSASEETRAQACCRWGVAPDREDSTRSERVESSL